MNKKFILLAFILLLEFHIMEEAGHVPQYERPEAVNPILIDFLKR